MSPQAHPRTVGRPWRPARGVVDAVSDHRCPAPHRLPCPDGDHLVGGGWSFFGQRPWFPAIAQTLPRGPKQSAVQRSGREAQCLVSVLAKSSAHSLAKEQSRSTTCRYSCGSRTVFGVASVHCCHRPPAARYGDARSVPRTGIEVKQCAESKGPVVDEVGLRQVAIKVSADQIGVRAGAEGGKSDAVSPAVGACAGQQEFADAAAELGPAGYSNQPGGSPTLSPTAFEKDAELSGSDLPGSLDQLPHEQVALHRSELPPSRMYRRPGVTNRRTRSMSSGSVLA